MPRAKKPKYDEDGCPDVNIHEVINVDNDKIESRQHTQQKIRSITINPPDYNFNNQSKETKTAPRPAKPKPGLKQVHTKPAAAPIKKDNRLEEAIKNDLNKRNIR